MNHHDKCPPWKRTSYSSETRHNLHRLNVCFSLLITYLTIFHESLIFLLTKEFRSSWIKIKIPERSVGAEHNINTRLTSGWGLEKMTVRFANLYRKSIKLLFSVLTIAWRSLITAWCQFENMYSYCLKFSQIIVISLYTN